MEIHVSNESYYPGISGANSIAKEARLRRKRRGKKGGGGCKTCTSDGTGTKVTKLESPVFLPERNTYLDEEEAMGRKKTSATLSQGLFSQANKPKKSATVEKKLRDSGGNAREHRRRTRRRRRREKNEE